MCFKTSFKSRRSWGILTDILSAFQSLAAAISKAQSPLCFSLRVNPISLSYPFPYPFVLPLALVPRNRVVSARGENIPRHHVVTVTSSYIIASWLLRHQRRQVLISNVPSASVCVSIAWVLVMFSLVREMRDCCTNQQCNVSMEK